MCRKLILLISFVSLFGLVDSASGDYSWTNYGGDRQWDNPYNWSPGGIPGPGDYATINPPPYEGPIINCDVYVHEIDGPTDYSSGNQVMDVIGGTIVINDDWQWSTWIGGTATLNISGSPDITIGDMWKTVLGTGTATLNISGSPYITVVNDWRSVDGSGTATTNICGSPDITVGNDWRNADGPGTVTTNISCCPDITIGGRWRDADKGTVTVNIDGDPNIIVKDYIKFADGPNSIATITMTGGFIEDWGFFKFGEDGDVIFSMSGGTFLIGVGAGTGKNWEFVARNGGNNTANISGTAYIYVEENILVGSNPTSPGVATINMSGGTIIDNNDMLVPAAPNATGILNMTGGNVNVNGHLEIGGWGTGQVSLYSGTIKTHTFGMRSSGGIGTMRICCNGVLIVDDPNGSVKATIDGYVANGWITCKDLGSFGPSVVWNGVDTTTVSCRPKKWSQPPIEIDPNVYLPPTYCGWDEESFTEDPCTSWVMVADDFRCLGSMPIGSIRWWGSYRDWRQPGVQPPQLPIAWRIGFWSNVPKDDPCNLVGFSYPEELLWQIEVDTNRVDVNEVGWDQHPTGYPNDVCYEYYADLEPNEIFWQGQFLDDTNDDIFWLSIAAVYSQYPTYPWGWKTRPWNWMDDAVRFGISGDPQPGIVVDPCSNLITPIEYASESYDVAFELDTYLCWTKCHQPFTGIREWPYYEDELSMAAYGPTTEAKWVQKPDLENGIDVDDTHWDRGPWLTQFLGDDFECTTTGPITDIYIWGSWFDDNLPDGGPGDVDFYLQIYSDNPVGPNGWSEPNQQLWVRGFYPGDFDVWPYAQDLVEGYYSPCIDYYKPISDTACWLYHFHIDPCQAFIQQGDPCDPNVYWLVVQNTPHDSDPNVRLGWKTSTDHWNDDAVWSTAAPGGPWYELRYPPGHPFEGNSIDLAFVIATTEIETEAETKWQQLPDPCDPCGWDVAFNLGRLADDWQCTKSGPVKDITFWVSWEQNQVQPINGFYVGIWSDFPDPDGAGPLYSEPNVLLWDRDFDPCDFTVIDMPDDWQGWFDPCGPYQFDDHNRWQQINIEDINNPFIQEQGEIYWLEIDMYGAPNCGWKESGSPHFGDDAVAWYAPKWHELKCPVTGESLDLAFEITTETEQQELVTRRLVADDWFCDQNAPVTTAVWWGSYIGYGYEACQAQVMAPPVKPNYFQLSMWTDVPAGAGIAKWSQLPDMNTGVDQYSVHFGDAVCSSDFECTDLNPVVAVRWWGSYLDGTDPGGGPNCKQFELVFHYDVPAGMTDPETGETLSYSHPTYPWLYYEHVTAEERYYGTTAGGEKVYEYIAWLPEPFHQQYWRNDCNNPVPGSGIFWLDIGYVDEENYYPPDVNWGWHESVDNRLDLSISNPSWHFGPWADVNVLDKDLAFEIITGKEAYSHPKDNIWEYKAYDYDEVLVGYDKHPHGAPNEPVFSYSVRLPEEDWFRQKEPESVYWFSVVAVYDENTPNYDWGWTNHEHVYNDDAVAGLLDPSGDELVWFWQKLYDQNGVSQDMSFMLFAEPNECVRCLNYSWDGIVNFIDYVYFADDWGWKGLPCSYNKSDLNCDGTVDYYDLRVFALWWLDDRDCP